MPTNYADLARRLAVYLRRAGADHSVQFGPGVAVGSVRGPFRKDNQDRAAVAYITSSLREPLLVGLICDGMGGMMDGGGAATIAASTFIAYLAVSVGPIDAGGLTVAIRAANDAVFERYRGAGGTTLTAVIIAQSGPGWVAHVGDSRLYERLSDEVLSLITKDDTIAGIARGPDGDDDELDSRLLQFVGIGKELEPHVAFLDQASHRQFLLTTDGAHSIGRRLLGSITSTPEGASEWVRRLMVIAEAASLQDNASAASIFIGEFVAPPAPPSGMAITLWTASQTVDLFWQVGEPSSESIENSQPQETSAPIKKRVRGKREPPKDPGATSPKRSGPKPQLSIKFGGEEPSR